MKVERCNCLIRTNLPKKNNESLNQSDLIKLGYMAGRYGINLDGNPNIEYRPVMTKDGLLINVNSCTKDALENNLEEAGINFSFLA